MITPFEKFSIVMMIITLALSITSIIWSYTTSKKTNKISLREKYYNDVFKNILIKQIPDLYTKFINTDNKTVDESISVEFESTIGELRKKIKFLKFTNEKVYTKMDKVLVKIDDAIVLLSSKMDSFERIQPDMEQSIKEIYKLVEKHYL